MLLIEAGSSVDGRARTVECRRWSFLVIVGVHLVGSFTSCLVRVGYNHSNDLTIMPDLIAFQGRRGATLPARGRRRSGILSNVLMSEDIEHARHILSRLQIEASNAAASNSAGHQKCIGCIRHRLVRGIPGCAGHLEAAVDAQRWLANDRVSKCFGHG